MALRDTYSYAIDTAKKFHMDGSAEERDGKLYFHGKVSSQDAANKIWDAIKTIPTWERDVVADIQATGGDAASAHGTSYTVKPGDTLSKIAKNLLGDANKYPKIFEENRDQLPDADHIKPGQVLRIPAA